MPEVIFKPRTARSPTSSPVGTEPNGFTFIRALAVSGSNVFAAGFFSIVGNEAIDAVAHWDGTKWQKLGTGIPSVASSGITALAASGERLYVGQTGNARANSVYVWNGTAWSTLPGILSAIGTGVFINSLVPDGPDLYAGGRFDEIEGVPVGNHCRLSSRLR